MNKITWIVLLFLCSCTFGQTRGQTGAKSDVIPMGRYTAVKPAAKPGEWIMFLSEDAPDELSKAQIDAAIRFIKDHPLRVIRLDERLKAYSVPTEINASFACHDIN